MRHAIGRIRYLRAWLARVRSTRRQEIGPESLLAAPQPVEGSPIPLPDCETCVADPLEIVTSMNPVEVGRQASRGEAILDVAAWLRCSGWSDCDAGYLQQYATWLLSRRAAYERGGVTAS